MLHQFLCPLLEISEIFWSRSTTHAAFSMGPLIEGRRACHPQQGVAEASFIASQLQKRARVIFLIYLHNRMCI